MDTYYDDVRWCAANILTASLHDHLLGFISLNSTHCCMETGHNFFFVTVHAL